MHVFSLRCSHISSENNACPKSAGIRTQRGRCRWSITPLAHHEKTTNIDMFPVQINVHKVWKDILTFFRNEQWQQRSSFPDQRQSWHKNLFLMPAIIPLLFLCLHSAYVSGSVVRFHSKNLSERSRLRLFAESRYSDLLQAGLYSMVVIFRNFSSCGEKFSSSSFFFVQITCGTQHIFSDKVRS